MLTLATSTTFLEQLKDPKAAVWVEFDKQYRPVLLAAARRSGLADSRADDAVQATFTTFYEKCRNGEYDREKGRLRSWLLGIAQYKFIEAYRSSANDTPNRHRVTKHTYVSTATRMASNYAKTSR